MSILGITNDKRYSIFLSSTYKDLIEHRKYAIETISKTHNFPICMELFHTSPQPTTQYIIDKIQSCDIFILMLGSNYGTKIKELGMSFTQFEYEQAKYYNKPILYFAIHEEDIKNLELKKEYVDFRKSIYRNDNFVSEFRLDADSISSVMSHSITSLVKNFRDSNVGGWVRSESYEHLLKNRLFSENQSNSPIFNRIIDRLSDFEYITAESSKNIAQKQNAARFFWSNYQSPILIDRKFNIYFEAGSTIDFFSQYLLDLLTEEVHLSKIKGSISIYFNGIYSKILYDLRKKDIPLVSNILYLPRPPIINKYGKTIGVLSKLPYRSPRHCDPESLRPDELKNIDFLKKEINKNLTERSVSFVSFSGLLYDNHYVPLTLSYRNYLFKRAMFEIDTNLVICIDDTKIDKRFCKKADHYYIFTKNEWFSILNNRSLCFVLSSENSKDSDEFQEFLETNGFQFFEREEHGYCTKIFTNNTFRSKCF